MLERLKELLTSITSLNRRTMIIIGTIVLGVLILGAVALSTLGTSSYSLLYGELSDEDSRQVIQFLDRQGITFDTSNGGNDIFVASDMVTTVRVQLAKEGLPSQASIGYELFDSDSAFGTSSLVQEVNRLRALEGELGRTISAIDGVQSVRVHIVLPRRELFSRERQDPSASVVVTTVGNQVLDRVQVQSILHIVATAVPDLELDNITVADDKGQLLARGGQGLGQLGGRSPDEIQIEFETRMARQLESILGNIVGYDKVRAEVRAEMDFSQQVVNSETFDPEGQVIRSEESIEEVGSRTRIPDQAVTVQNNIPENELVTAPQPTETENNARTEERINYEISSESINTVTPPGQLERLSVAVLVDGTYTRSPDGSRVYQPRTQEEMEAISRLVKSAIGFNNIDRRDQVEIVNLQFSTNTLQPQQVEQLIFGIPASDFRQIIEALVLAIVILLIAFSVIRPLLKRLIGEAEDAPLSIIGPDGKPMLVDRRTGLAIRDQAGAVGQAGTGRALATAESADPNAPATRGAEYGDDEMVNLINLKTKIRGNIVNRLNNLIEQYPNETANVVREWVSHKQ